MKLTLGRKLGLGFASILALMIVSSIVTYWKAAAIRQTQDRITAVRVPTIGAAKDMQRDLNQTQSKGRQAILAGNEPERREAANKAFYKAWDDIGADVARLDELASKWTLQANRERWAEVKKQLPGARQSQEAILKEATSGDHDAVVKA